MRTPVGKKQAVYRDFFSLHIFLHRCGKSGRRRVRQASQTPPRSVFSKLTTRDALWIT